jgi:cobalt-zinc-cadmium efflux system outer membrane protein
MPFKQLVFLVLFVAGSTLSIYAQSGKPYNLQQALITARANNPILKGFYFDVMAGESDITTAKLRPNPVLNNQTLQLVNNRYFFENTRWNNAHNRQVWYQLTKPFQLFNQRKYKIEYAEHNYDFLRKNYTETERNLFLQVAGKWLEVWGNQKQVDVLQVAQANIDTLAQINALRLKNQVISQTDFIRTRLLVDQYGIQLKTALQRLKNSRNELRFLLGLQDSVDIDMENEPVFPMLINIDTLRQLAIRERADINMARVGVTLSNSNVKLQKSLAWPVPELGMIWNPQNTVPYVGFFGTLELPLFTRNQGEIQRSLIQRRQAEYNVQVLETQINTEINTAYNSFVTQQNNVQRFKEIIGQSETILGNVRYAYLRGGTTIIDFLEAQRSWLETQQQYFDAQQQYRQSYIQLLFVTGLINQLAQ